MALSEDLKKKYRPTIGIECHVQLKTKTKLFAAVGNDARDAPPNSLVSHICLGLPGALPVLNAEAVSLGIRAGLALKAKVEPFSKFERKHYFYPDLPKGYQISQYEQPIISKGSVTIQIDGETKSIGITRAHMEEDAGKNTHPEGVDYSLVDLNRAGTPLLEIVSEPDIHSAVEAKAYARELYLLMKYADVSDCDLYYGNMRFDVNISLSSDPQKLGKRTEIKNLNSFRAVENSVLYEIERQTELLEKNQPVVQETRGWDEAKQKTFSQRSKEEAQDYRYMPDPDIPPIVISDEQLNKLQEKMAVLPDEWRKRLKDLSLDQATIETLIEAEVEDPLNKYLYIIEAVRQNADQAKVYVNWIVNVIVPAQREGTVNVSDSQKRLAIINGVYELFSAGKLSSTAAKSLLIQLLKDDNLPPAFEKYAEEQGYIQVSDSAELEKIVSEVLTENEAAAQDVKNGEMKAVGFLVGQVMKKSLGKANPAMVQEIIKKQLGV